MLGFVPEAMVRSLPATCGSATCRGGADAGRLAGRADRRQFNQQLLDHLRAVLAARAQGKPGGWRGRNRLGPAASARHHPPFAGIDFSARVM